MLTSLSVSSLLFMVLVDAFFWDRSAFFQWGVDQEAPVPSSEIHRKTQQPWDCGRRKGRLRWPPPPKMQAYKYRRKWEIRGRRQAPLRETPNQPPQRVPRLQHHWQERQAHSRRGPREHPPSLQPLHQAARARVSAAEQEKRQQWNLFSNGSWWPPVTKGLPRRQSNRR